MVLTVEQINQKSPELIIHILVDIKLNFSLRLRNKIKSHFICMQVNAGRIGASNAVPTRRVLSINDFYLIARKLFQF